MFICFGLCVKVSVLLEGSYAMRGVCVCNQVSGMEGGVCAVSSHELCPFDLNITLFHGFIFSTIRNKIFNPYQ